MPVVNGKKFAYTKAGKAAAKKAEGYGPNPADQPKVGDDGYMEKAPKTLKQPGSSEAERGRTKMRARNAAIKKMKKTGLIPASPTR